MALKFLGDDPDCGWDDQAIAAIAYAKSFGVRISNNSWARPASAPPFGSPADDLPLYEAIEDSGMLFVVAAGNNGQDLDNVSRPSIPASFDLPNILSVAAVDNTGQLASFSNYGETSVDVAAPGVDIASTFPDYDGNDAGYYWLSGTSMAAPHVSAIAALVGSQAPTLLDTPTDLKKRILDTAKNVGDTGGLTLTGRVASAAAAIDHTDPTTAAPNSYAFVTGTAIGSTISTRVRWPAGTDDLSGVGSYALRQSVNGAAWTTVTASTAGLSLDRSLTFSTAYRYRVRAQDRAGNTGEYVDGPQVHPKLTQQNGTGVTYSGTWTSRSSSSASGGSTRYATKAGAWVQFSFTGRAVAVIAPKGASRGSFKAYVDGTYVGTVERLPELLAVADGAVRPELEHVRQPQGQARPHRHVRPSPLRHRRIRVPAVARPLAAPVGRHGVGRKQQRDVVAASRVGDAQVDGDLREERGVLVGDVELEAVVARRQRPFQQVAHAPVSVGQGLGHADGRRADVEPIEHDADPGRGLPTLRVEDVGRDRRSAGSRRVGHAILRAWVRCGSRSVTCTLAPAGRRPRRRRSTPSGGCCRSSRR